MAESKSSEVSLSAGEVKRWLEETVVEEHWRSKYKLCVTNIIREGNGWILKGLLSRPTKTKPIPSAVAHITFKIVELDVSSSKYRLESQLAWRSVENFKDIFIDRIISDKVFVGAQHKTIVEDSFGSTRVQIAFSQETQEEQKIAKEKETVYYTDESDDEYLADEVVFRGEVPQYEVDLEDIIRNKHIHIREVVEEVFAQGPDMDYFACIEALDDVAQQLELQQEDLILLYAHLGENASMKVNLTNLVPKVISKLQRRLTHPKQVTLSEEWSEEYLTVHSPGFERCCAEVRERFSTHIENQECMPRESARQTLENEGEGLLEMEINAILALLPPAEAAANCVVIEEDKLEELLKTVRLAFARDCYLQYSSVEQVEQHVWNLLGPFLNSRTNASAIADVAEEKSSYSEEKEEKERDEAKEGSSDAVIKLTRAQIYHALIHEKTGLVLSKQMAMVLLASCPSISEAEDYVSAHEFAFRCAKSMFEYVHPNGLARTMILSERCVDSAMNLVRGRTRDEFNAELWPILESHFPDRMVPAMSSNSFTDCITTFLGESISNVLVDALASANISLDSPSEVKCKPFTRFGYDYTVLLSKALALQDERAKEENLNDQLVQFKRQYGPLEIISVEPVNGQERDTVRLSVFCSEMNINTEAEFSSTDLSELLGLEEGAKAFLEPEIDPSILSLLQEFMFLDAKHKLVIHVPLGESF